MRRSLTAIAVLVVLAGVSLGSWAWARHRFDARPNYRFGTGLVLQSGSRGNMTAAVGDAMGRALVVWSNHDGHGSSDMHREHGILILSGEVPSDEGPVPFRCEVANSRSGTMSIGGATYDLARGTVFLVSADRRTPRITQLDRASTRLQPGATNDSVIAELKKDPQIHAFLTADGNSTQPALPTTQRGE